VKKILIICAVFVLFPGLLHGNAYGDAPNVSPYAKSSGKLPANFPVITTEVYGETAPGKVFLATLHNDEGIGSYIMVLENDGSPYFYRELPNTGSADFKRLPNGYYSYADFKSLRNGYYSYFDKDNRLTHRILNMNFEEVDMILMGNGYQSDAHCFQLLPNGHFFLCCYDEQITDLTAFGGHPDATLITPVLQELDTDKNVVWQWRFLDFLNPEDGPYRLDRAYNEIIHLNSIELDHDGHVLVSNLRMENCMKINRQTGEVMWVLGGQLNDFSFVGCDPNEAVGWFDGHDFRRLENGHVLFFDNNDGYSSNISSRVLEFELDEANMRARLIWEYVPDPLVLRPSRGNAQRLPNGNTMIGWGDGSYFGGPVCTEVNAAGEKLFELKWAEHAVLTSYRAFRFPVDYEPATDVVVEDIVQGNSYDFIQDTVDSGISITVEGMNGDPNNQLQITTYDWAPVAPTFAGHDPRAYKNRVVMSAESISAISGKISFDTEVFNISNPEDITIYHRQFEGAGMFSPLTTVYDDTQAVITAGFAGVGEFIITYPDLQPIPFAPNPIVPEEGKLVNQDLPLTIQWSPRGFITEFGLQIATDPAFSNVVAYEPNFASTLYEFSGLSPETTYYWRVRTRNHGGISDWSNTASFTATAPYITVTAPNGNESWNRGLDYFITWQDNLDEEVVIELYEADQHVMTLDTVDSDGGYQWEADLGLEAGCDYSIKIKSSIDETLFDISDDAFSIDMPEGDFDCDGCVEADDLAVLAGEWTQEQAGLTADLDGNDKVDFNDFAIFAENWMESCP